MPRPRQVEPAAIALRFQVGGPQPAQALAKALRVDRSSISRALALPALAPQVVRLGVRLDNGAVQGSHANSPQLVITVEDDGQGLPLPTSVPGAQHAGRSGLANMRRRVEDLGGRFVIESRPGGGTRIELAVPLETDSATVPGLRKGQTS